MTAAGLTALFAAVTACVLAAVAPAFAAGRDTEGLTAGKKGRRGQRRRSRGYGEEKPGKAPSPKREKGGAAAGGSREEASRQAAQLRNFFLYDGTERPVPGEKRRTNGKGRER